MSIAGLAIADLTIEGWRIEELLTGLTECRNRVRGWQETISNRQSITSRQLIDNRQSINKLDSAIAYQSRDHDIVNLQCLFLS